MHIIRQKLVAQSPTALKRILLATLLLVAGLPSSAITFSADSTDLDMSEFKKELAEYYKKSSQLMASGIIFSKTGKR